MVLMFSSLASELSTSTETLLGIIYYLDTVCFKLLLEDV